MSFASKAAKLLTNKYVLYFVFFLAITNVLGYLVMNKLNAVIFFALIGLLMSYFSKNMIVVLGVCILATNLIMANKTLREGLENSTDTSTPTSTTPPSTPTSTTTTTPTSTTSPPPSNKKKPPSEDPIVPIPDDAPIKDMNNMDMNKTSVEEDAPQPVVDAMKTGNKKNSRIDYASTLEEAYDNLDGILGGDGIKNLTQDTQKLMENNSNCLKA